ncbi:MAG: hypothetical protein JWL83_984 [Actinomycetia bacterium]|nr:hypothetical protein [Actinomycetes bacterium]
MAPVLQCPDCGQKHPLENVADTPAFRCRGCGRMLKVPTELLPTAEEPPPPAHFPPRRVPEMRAPASSLPILPRLVRIGIWFVAMPLAFIIVFGFARTFHVFTQRQMENTFLQSGWGRFWPIMRLLPFWALGTTLLVHFSNIGIARWRIARKQGGGRGSGKPSSSQRTRSRSRSRRPPARVAS